MEEIPLLDKQYILYRSLNLIHQTEGFLHNTTSLSTFNGESCWDMEMSKTKSLKVCQEDRQE